MVENCWVSWMSSYKNIYKGKVVSTQAIFYAKLLYNAYIIIYRDSLGVACSCNIKLEE